MFHYKYSERVQQGNRPLAFCFKNHNGLNLEKAVTVYIWSHVTGVFCGEGIFYFSSSGSLNIFFCKFKVEI